MKIKQHVLTMDQFLNEQKNQLNEGLKRSTIDSYHSHGGEYWVDANSNAWSCEDYSEEQAQKLSSSLIEWNCFGCINCSGCRFCKDCVNCRNCEMCTQCIDCRDCAGLDSENGTRC